MKFLILLLGVSLVSGAAFAERIAVPSDDFSNLLEEDTSAASAQEVLPKNVIEHDAARSEVNVNAKNGKATPEIQDEVAKLEADSGNHSNSANLKVDHQSFRSPKRTIARVYHKSHKKVAKLGRGKVRHYSVSFHKNKKSKKKSHHHVAAKKIHKRHQVG